MNIFNDTYEVSKTEEFSKLNKLVVKFQLIEFLLLPVLISILLIVVHPIVDNLVSESTYFVSAIKFSIPIWFGSIISFIFGIITIYLSIKGIKNSFGKKKIFIFNLLLGLFGLLLLSVLTFFPQYYIKFDVLLK